MKAISKELIIQKLRKKEVLIAMAIAAVLIIVIAVIAGSQPEEETEDTVFVKKQVSKVSMTQTISAAGKVTAAESRTISMNKSRIFKAMNVDTNEMVKKGQPMVFYTDGSHTDAPADGMITAISAPKNGERPDDSDSLEFSSTRELYIKVLIPEDTINKISKGDSADIIVNAYPNRKFEGKIINMQDISTELAEKYKQSSEEAKNNSEEEEESSSEGDESDDTEVSEDNTEESSGEEGDSEGGDVAYFAVNVKFRNDGTLMPGMSASTVITISDRKDVLAVPVEAVYFDKAGKSYVYRYNGKEPEKVMVKTGECDPMNVEILEGLKLGDTVRVEKAGGVK